eukprot:258304_1
MGECCSDLYECIDDCINPTGEVGLTPDARVRGMKAIRDLFDANDYTNWPDGMSLGVLSEVFRTWDLEENDARFPVGYEDDLMKLMTEVKDRFLAGLNDKEQTIHTIMVKYISAQPQTFRLPQTEYLTITQTIMELLQNEYLSAADPNNIGKFDKKGKKFVKFLLSWCFHDPFNTGNTKENFPKLIKIATDCMDVLQIPLNEEYDRIAQGNDESDRQLLELEYKRPESAPESQRELYPEWTRFVQENHNDTTDDYPPKLIEPTIELFRKHQLPSPDIVPFLFDLSGDVEQSAVHIEFFRQVAMELDPPFQSEMQQLFEQNRKEYKGKVGGGFEEDKDAAFKGAPIKTAGRARVKEQAYMAADDPICGNIKDWVRCAFIVYDTSELMMLYEALLKKYGDNIIRVKNGFKQGTEGNYGYRAVLMNLVYEHHGLRMVVEIQLILLKYLKVRKSMHLFYKIVRAKNARHFVKDVSKVQDIDNTKTKQWVDRN